MDETPRRRFARTFGGRLLCAGMVAGSASMAAASTANASLAMESRHERHAAHLHAQVQMRALITLPVPHFAPLAGAGPVAESDFGTPSADSLLAATRGGSDTTVNDTRLAGVVGGNTAVQVVTGSNVIQASSFADAAGIPIVIQNTGANVLIQNATVINLKFN